MSRSDSGFTALLLVAMLAAMPAEAWRGRLTDPDPQNDEGSQADSSAEFVAEDYEYCLVCHGAEGQGNRALEAPVLVGMEPWSLRNQLQAFREGWRGRDERDLAGREMYPMATALNASEIEAVIDYVVALPPVSAGAFASQQLADAAVAGDPKTGAKLFLRCVSCHGRDAAGIREMQGPALAYQDPVYLQRQLRYFRDGIRGAAKGDLRGARMADAVREFSDSELRDVVSYIASLRP